MRDTKIRPTFSLLLLLLLLPSLAAGCFVNHC